MKIRTTRGDLDALALMMTEFEKHLAAMNRQRSRLKQETVKADLAKVVLGSRSFFKGLIAVEDGEACGYLLYHFGFNANVRRGSLVV